MKAMQLIDRVRDARAAHRRVRRRREEPHRGATRLEHFLEQPLDRLGRLETWFVLAGQPGGRVLGVRASARSTQLPRSENLDQRQLERRVAIGITPSISGNPHFKAAQRACIGLLKEGGAGGLRPPDFASGTIAVPAGRGVHPLARHPELPGSDVRRRRRAPAAEPRASTCTHPGCVRRRKPANR